MQATTGASPTNTSQLPPLEQQLIKVKGQRNSLAFCFVLVVVLSIWFGIKLVRDTREAAVKGAAETAGDTLRVLLPAAIQAGVVEGYNHGYQDALSGKPSDPQKLADDIGTKMTQKMEEARQRERGALQGNNTTP